MINIELIVLLGVMFGIGYKIMDKIDEFIENGGISKEEN